YRGPPGGFHTGLPRRPAPSPAPRRRSRRWQKNRQSEFCVASEGSPSPKVLCARQRKPRRCAEKIQTDTLSVIALYHNADTVSTIPAGRGTAGRIHFFARRRKHKQFFNIHLV